MQIVPDYSTDIAAAMEVIEKMWHQNLMPRLWKAQMWNVEFWQMDGDAYLGSYSGNSLPEAICRAALEAVELRLATTPTEPQR